jgi:hypothetical protein
MDYIGLINRLFNTCVNVYSDANGLRPDASRIAQHIARQVLLAVAWSVGRPPRVVPYVLRAGDAIPASPVRPGSYAFGDTPHTKP